MSFGKRLKDARNRLGLTQEDLASAVGVTKGAIGNYESEFSSPKETILIKLMNVLQVDANYLYQDFITSSQLLDSEMQLIIAYRKADPGIQASIKKLLDLSDENEKKLTKSSAG